MSDKQLHDFTTVQLYDEDQDRWTCALVDDDGNVVIDDKGQPVAVSSRYLIDAMMGASARIMSLFVTGK